MQEEIKKFEVMIAAKEAEEKDETLDLDGLADGVQNQSNSKG